MYSLIAALHSALPSQSGELVFKGNIILRLGSALKRESKLIHNNYAARALGRGLGCVRAVLALVTIILKSTSRHSYEETSIVFLHCRGFCYGECASRISRAMHFGGVVFQYNLQRGRGDHLSR